jgi:hypothetical protein
MPDEDSPRRCNVRDCGCLVDPRFVVDEPARRLPQTVRATIEGGEGTIDFMILGNQGVRGAQVTLTGLKLDYGEMKEIRVRIRLTEDGVLEAEMG